MIGAKKLPKNCSRETIEWKSIQATNETVRTLLTKKRFANNQQEMAKEFLLFACSCAIRQCIDTHTWRRICLQIILLAKAIDNPAGKPIRPIIQSQWEQLGFVLSS